MNWLWVLLACPAFLLGELNWKADTPPPFAVSITIDPQQVPLDELVSLEAVLRYPSSYELDQASLLDHLAWSANRLAPQFTIFEASLTPISSEEGMQAQKLTVKIAPLNIGLIQVSLFRATFLPKEANHPPVDILTPVFILEVLPSQDKGEQAYAPLAPLATQFPLGLTLANREFLIDSPQRLQEEMQRNRRRLAAHSFPWLAIVIFIIASGLGWIAYLLRDFWPKKEAKKIKPPDPKELLEISVKKLQESRPIKKEQLKAYYAELTTILLIAIQEHLGIQTTSLTTPELVQVLKDQPSLASGMKEKILSFLAEADLIKFANQEALEESAKRAYACLRSLIEQLKQP